MDYNSIAFKGMWTESTPGLPTYGNYSVNEFGQNPYIILNLKKVTDCLFTLVQDDGRFYKQEFPYKR
eukprot:CAMPEP_0116892476 /NCGR_PEP_ID=MMETSP0467-20121206/2687_1 /TAXON_ID=283647 /ORGANISM="Mesodinium pulex, Strain SPMC105" /LENGTH=66 /DNA_ID=CAMNT_0004561619 /DNA_START=1470 /DNA_END=1670 /DNA_ORIENTATION=-